MSADARDAGPIPRTGAGPRAALAWAPFLACSWTWCVGMFLPILMLRDFGWIGFVVFCVPNVVGAGAVGWFVRSPEASRRWIEAHAPVMRLFSWITIAFHGYWLGWMTRWLPFEGAATLVAWVAGGVGLSALVAMRLRGTQIAWGVWCLSAGVLVYLLATGEARPTPVPPLAPPSSLAILWLAPLMSFGFLLCPLLDLTLHRARRGAGESGRAAFALGFGVCFLTMVLLTWVYAGRLLDPDTRRGLPEMLIVVHIIAQLCFTVGEHTRDLARSPARRMIPIGIGLVFAACLAGGLLAGGHGAIDLTKSSESPALAVGEIGYRALLASYGCLFPAYVWICLIPRGGGPIRRPSRRTIAVWLIATAAAVPFLTIGYLGQRHEWLAPGLLVMLVARLFVPRSPRHSS
ncbi:MAG: hypothetical protein AAGK04_09760 [Planctomycetota bacterium]